MADLVQVSLQLWSELSPSSKGHERKLSKKIMLTFVSFFSRQRTKTVGKNDVVCEVPLRYWKEGCFQARLFIVTPQSYCFVLMLFSRCNLIGCQGISGQIMQTMSKSAKGPMRISESDTWLAKITFPYYFLYITSYQLKVSDLVPKVIAFHLVNVLLMI